jgi:photosystem II stability/assembly factor-like uncharacterized protein
MTSRPAPYLIFSFMAALLLPCAFAAAQGWEWQNPAPHGQRVNDILCYFPDRVIAVCDNGYFMVSGDAGQTWITTRMPGSNTHNFKVARFGNGALLMVADRGRIFRSTDNASSWTRIYDANVPSPGYSAYDLATLGPLAVALLGGTHVAISHDDGLTWSKLPNPFPGSEVGMSLSIQSPQVWWLLTNRTLYRTGDAGVTWTRESQIKAQGLQRLVFVDSLYGYQLREGQLLQTHDGGEGWVEMDIFGFGSVTDLDAGHGLGDAVFCMSQGRYLLNVSPDAGATWNIGLTENAFADALPNTISFADARTGLIAGDGGRILRTTDAGVTWSIVSGSGYIGTTSKVLFADAQRGVTLTYAPTILLTGDGGRHWAESIPDPDVYFTDVDHLGSGVLHALAESYDGRHRAYRSSDMGLHWERLADLPVAPNPWQPIGVNSITAVSGSELWVGASYGICYHSTNGGISWDSLFIGDPDVDYSSGASIFHFPPAWLIYTRPTGATVSSDGGATWDIFSGSEFGMSIWSQQYVSPETAFGLLGGKFARTTNGGRTWRQIGDLTLQLLHFFDATRGVALWLDPQEDDVAYLLRTSDAGDTWESHRIGERVDWYSWFFLNPDLGWTVGNGGCIRRTINGGVVHVETVPAVSGFEIGAVYPHPFSPSQHGAATVPFHLDGTARHVRLAMFDALGREVAVLADADLGPGSYTARLDASALPSNLPPGLYLLSLQAGADRTSRPLLIVR